MSEPESPSLTPPISSRAEFRRRLAGLADPGRIISPTETSAFRELVRDIVVSLCIVHDDQALDRNAIWSRIDSGLQSACAKVDDGDPDRWLDLLLNHVKADPARTVRLGLLRAARASLGSRDVAHRRAFISWVETHRYAALSLGRDAWEEWKATNRHAAGVAGRAEKDAGATAAEIRRAAIVAHQGELSTDNHTADIDDSDEDI